ncbi:MAG: nuclear transport factor 2 family protein [Pseudomonadota bacterium]
MGVKTAAVLFCGAVVLLCLSAIIQHREDRLNSADRADIQDAIARYAYHWDGKDADAFSALFTEDAVMERWLLGELKSRLEGRAAILDYAKASHTGRLADRQTRHHMTGIVFTQLTDETAATQNMVLITHQTASDATPQPVSTGVYRITWRKTNETWQITKRVLLTDRVAGPG